ncbi:MAG: N-acetylmuramic acid 6-phosphate etherase [Candidatus Sericytochromatia bacterium]|nr:N-acetylmuramic acid 6-phosphate etherase [Candidatus Sericytochromatia bacterium]
MAHGNPSKLVTEARNPLTDDLDLRSIDDIVDLMNNQDRVVVEAIGREREKIGQAVQLITTSMQNGGRLFYVGAGTSGRLGMLDAAECPPTFSTDPDLVQGIIAGGPIALIQAVEGAEDSPSEGASDIIVYEVNHRDVVVGIAASGTTLYVHGALQAAKKIGATTILLACNPVSRREGNHIDLAITPIVGPEIISGSTRLKAGTATKMVLNMLSTITMIKLGKVYGNLMVDVKISNQKLRRRAIDIIKQVTSLDDHDAAALLDASGGKVKTAIVMALRDIQSDEADALLAHHKGYVRAVINAKSVSQ